MTDTAQAQVDPKKVMDTIVKAKVGVVMDDPFFATLLLHSGLHEDTSIDTMATDGERIFYAPKFVFDHNVIEIKATIVHEILHIVFDDVNRIGDRDAERWNIAGDIRINRIMDDTKRSGHDAYTLPNGVVRNNALYDAGRGVIEAIYDLLPPGNGGGGGGGNKGGQHQPGKGWSDLRPKPGQTAAERQAVSQEWKMRVAQARNVAKAMGKMPAHLDRMVSEVLKPRVNWQQVLRNFCAKRARVEWSYANPRFTLLDDGVIMPSLGGERIGAIWTACDVSGSISDHQKNEFAAELRSIWEDLRPDSLDMVFFSHHVTGHDHIDRGEDFIFNARGGGGTAIGGVFDLIARQAEQPELLVVLTDLYIPDIPKQPVDYPVLWVCNQPDQTAPWGHTIYMDVPKVPKTLVAA